MLFSILTLFPPMFAGPFDFSIVKRAAEKSKVKINFVNIRDFATDNYKTVDDRPYGGGVGMILRVDVVDRALEYAKCQLPSAKTYTILLDPRGRQYYQAKARELSSYDHLILICGHYEDVDARVYKLVDEVISIGNFVLTGGEIPAMLIVDSVTRLLPGVLEKAAATGDESFSQDLLASPQYTRPEVFKGMRVPEVLLSGDHAKIAEWKNKQKGEIPTA